MAYNINVFANDTIRITVQTKSSYETAKLFVGSTINEEFSIDWGGGKAPVIYKQLNNIGKSAEYIYANAGTYEITIVPTEACRITRLDCCGYIDTYSSKSISIKLNNNTTLETLNCSNNQLTSLDVSGCTVLQSLHCDDNQLKNLDVSENAKLTTLRCQGNQLSNLNLNKNLEVLYCSKNELITLYLRECNTLTQLYCSNNQLSNLDVSQNTKLTYLDCQANQLNSLDLSKNTELKELFCNSNQLNSLDLSNISMQNLFCSNNKLTNLVIRSVQNLSCSNNHLSLADLYAVSQKSIQKILGTQTLMSQTVSLGKALFSDQSVFNGKYTKYVVTKNDVPAPVSDYSINNGKITFNSLGSYIITMTNEAVDLSGAFPAQVKIELEVVEGTGIADISLPNFTIFPNPTSNSFFVEYEGFNIIKLFDMLGNEVLSQNINGKTEINISHLSKGIYSVSILSQGKFIGNSKIVKQ